MALILCCNRYADCSNCHTKEKTCTNWFYAKQLYNANCRVIDKNSVLLSREEYERLLKIKEEASVKETNYFSNLFKLQKELEQVEKERDSAIDNCDRKSKETAEKFESELKAFIKVWKMTDDDAMSIPFYRTLFKKIGELAKQFGVEIKE